MTAALRDRCQRCILPLTFPGLSLDEEGICTYCREAGSPEEMSRDREAAITSLWDVISNSRGRAESDCIVAFSGGKDSTFVLQWLVNVAQLRCIAVTVDNGFISPQALENGHAVTDALGVDWILYRPAPTFMRKLYRESAVNPGIHAPSAALRASATCQSCIHLINTYVVRLALERGTPLVAGGYLSGQVPRGTSSLRIDHTRAGAAREATSERYHGVLGADAGRYLAVPARPGSSHVTVLNPLLAIRVTEDEILASIAPLGWKRASDTGRQSTNCRLNDLGIFLHQRYHGFNPYLLEMAAQVREGLLSRDEALTRAEAIPPFEAVQPLAWQIGLEL